MKKQAKVIYWFLIAVLFVAMAGTGFGKMAVLGKNLKYDPNVPVNGGKAITVNLWYPEDVKNVEDKWAADYQKIHPNVKINIVNSIGWGDYWNKLPIALKSGTGPDMFHMHHAFIETLLPVMAPWPKAMVAAARKDFMGIAPFTIEGKVYQIPTGMMTAVICYNKKIWAGAGLTEADIPKTWDQLRAVAKKLVKKDAAGKILVNGFDFNGNGQFILNALKYQKGSYYYKKDGVHTNWNTPAALAAANYLLGFIQDGVVDPKGPSANEAFGNGRSAMIYIWGWFNNYMKNNFPSVEYGAFPLPTWDGKMPPAYDRSAPEVSLTVSAKANPAVQKVCFDFVKYTLANDAVLLDWDLSQAIAPSKISLLDNDQFARIAVIKAESAVITHCVMPGIQPQYTDTLAGPILNDGIFVQALPPAEQLKKYDAECDKHVAEAKLKTAERTYPYAKLFQEE